MYGCMFYVWGHDFFFLNWCLSLCWVLLVMDVSTFVMHYVLGMCMYGMFDVHSLCYRVIHGDDVYPCWWWLVKDGVWGRREVVTREPSLFSFHLFLYFFYKIKNKLFCNFPFFPFCLFVIYCIFNIYGIKCKQDYVLLYFFCKMTKTYYVYHFIYIILVPKQITHAICQIDEIFRINK